MADILEGTDIFNAHHARVTGEIPITVHNGGDGMTPMMVTVSPPYQDRMHDDDPYAGKPSVVVLDGPLTDPFDDDTPIVASCDLENPESCESCT